MGNRCCSYFEVTGDLTGGDISWDDGWGIIGRIVGVQWGSCWCIVHFEVETASLDRCDGVVELVMV